MRRIDAFEFNESAWCPRFVRDSIVETLGNGLRWGRIYHAAGPTFAEFVERARVDRVLDLCSGSGEPASILTDALVEQGFRPPRFVLSDLFPNEPAFERVAARHPGRIEFVREPVDATAVPAGVDQPARMVISAFHHFSPAVAGRLLADSVAKRRPIFILEGFPRALLRLPSILPSMTAAMFANPVLAGRDRLKKAAFTYLLPLIPAAGMWDAIVSVLRVHSEEELRAMVRPLAEDWEWDYRTIPWSPGGCAVAFMGIPRP